MKKYLLIIILQFMSIGLFGFDTSALERLLSGETELAGADFTNADLTGKTFEGVDFTGANFTGARIVSSWFRNSKLDNAIFTDANLAKTNFIRCTHKNMIILKTKGMNSQTIKNLKKNGALIVSGSIMCNSDLHVNVDVPGNKKKRDFTNSKLKHAKRMLNVAKDKKNKVKGIIYAGDMVDYGRIVNWEKFKKHFIVPFWKVFGRNNLYLCIGNHDRYAPKVDDEVGFNYQNPVTREIEKYCKNVGSRTGDYYVVPVPSINSHICSGGECPVRNNGAPISLLRSIFIREKSFGGIGRKIKNIIFFSHYSPMYNIDWWSQSNYPRANKIFRGAKIQDKEETKIQRWIRKKLKKKDITEKEAKKRDKENGRKAIKYFTEKINEFKDKISIYVTGHKHKGFIKYWNGILTLGVGGGDWFAVLFFTEEGVLVSVELVEKARVVRYYPKLFGLKAFVTKSDIHINKLPQASTILRKLPWWGPKD